MKNATVETITLETARKWLAKNTGNRPLRQPVIAKYVSAMRDKQWTLNGETIKFSETNRLLDGQHRLAAIVESGVTIQSYVVRDLPEDVFDTIDTGKNRSISDLLSLSGEANESNLGVALRMQYVHDELGSMAEFNSKIVNIITNRDLMETFDKHPNLPKSVTFVLGVKGLSKIITPPNAAYCHYQFSQLEPAFHANTFFMRLAERTDQEKGNPVHELRYRLERLSRGSRASRIETIALTIKAFNAFREQKEIKTLYYDKGDDFPVAA